MEGATQSLSCPGVECAGRKLFAGRATTGSRRSNSELGLLRHRIKIETMNGAKLLKKPRHTFEATRTDRKNQTGGSWEWEYFVISRSLAGT
jgi:hypothetical protein